MLSGNLEYLISSLPDLVFSKAEERQSRVSSLLHKYAVMAEDSQDLVTILTAEAKKFTTNAQYEYLKDLQFNTVHHESFMNSSYKVVSQFSHFMYALKREIRDLRMARLSDKNPQSTTFEFIPELSADPLEAEEQLLEVQWHKLNELSIGHYADFSALLLYKLKLQLLLRWWGFDREKGMSNLKKYIKIEQYG
jgi:hypothetical protein